MTNRAAGSVLTGLGTGALVVASAFIPGWAESKLGHAVLWPVYAMQHLFPAPCFDMGPGKPPFCEGTPVQLVTGLFGLALAFVVYAAIGTGLTWLALRRSGVGAEPAA